MRRLALLVSVAVMCLGASIAGVDVNQKPGYYTVAVFGDLQAMTEDYREGGAAFDRYGQLDRAADWILANAERENIVFAMAVGDLISAGVDIPPDGSQCDAENGTYTVPEGSNTCFNLRLTDKSTCEAEPGCYWPQNDGDSSTCVSCNVIARAETEWEGLDALVARFAPGADLTDGLPLLMVRGNHDNVGTQNATDTDREPEGWNQRYSTAYWDALDGDYGSRAYEHIASYTDTTNGDGHAWMMAFGDQPILVVSIACCSLEGIPDAQETWALDILDNYPGTPAIMLVHHANAIETTIIDSGDAPNVFAYFGGHDGQRLKSIRSPGAKDILRSETDWTTASGTPANDHDENGVVRRDYITLARFYLNESPTKVEVFDYSPSGRARHAQSGNSVATTALDIMP